MKRYSLVYKYINEINDLLSRIGTYIESDIIVSKKDNFDELLMTDHISSNSHETFTLKSNMILRTHTTAFQAKLFKEEIHSMQSCINSCSHKLYYTLGKVFRKDDSSRHLYVFHQLDGVIVGKELDAIECIDYIMYEIIFMILGKKMPFRVRSVQFPFTEMDVEVELFNDTSKEFMEVLGCGLVNSKIMSRYNMQPTNAFAFGIGIDRLILINENILTIKNLID